VVPHPLLAADRATDIRSALVAFEHPFEVFLHTHARNVPVTPAATRIMLGALDKRAIRRAALVTVRRAIVERFPPGPVRERWPAGADLLCRRPTAQREPRTHSTSAT
jgi:hypothetical protein